MGLFNELKSALHSLGLNIDDVRGQGYDNGSNMKGKHQGVQTRLLEINPRALYMPCACHSLNLTLCDMGKSYRQTIISIIHCFHIIWHDLGKVSNLLFVKSCRQAISFFLSHPTYIHIVCKIYQKVEDFGGQCPRIDS